MLKRLGLALLFYMVAATALGQITVPAESKEHTPIPVTLKAMVPDGATIQSGPGLVWPEGVNKLEVGPGQWVVCASPGEYTITYKVRWLHIVPITFKDFDGKEVTFQNYLGSGDVDEKATFKVLGGTPPVPPPDPLPPGTRRAVVLEETEQRTPAQSVLFQSLTLAKKALVLDDDQPSAQKYLSLLPSSMANVRPVLLVIAEGDKLVRAVPCPTSIAAVDEELKR